MIYSCFQYTELSNQIISDGISYFVIVTTAYMYGMMKSVSLSFISYLPCTHVLTFIHFNTVSNLLSIIENCAYLMRNLQACSVFD